MDIRDTMRFRLRFLRLAFNTLLRVTIRRVGVLGWSTHNVADFAALELKAISSLSELGFPRVARMIIQCIAIFGLLVSCSIMFCGDLR